MRIIAAGLTVAALLLSAASVSGQERKDGGLGTDKGQSERPADPKHIDPESSSHNADKPKQNSDTGSSQPATDDKKQPANPK
jgi:hypothetical protein